MFTLYVWLIEKMLIAKRQLPAFRLVNTFFLSLALIVKIIDQILTLRTDSN